MLKFRSNVKAFIQPSCSVTGTTGSFQLRIVGEIGVPEKTDAAAIKKQIDALVNKGVKSLVVYINSGGGSCFDSNEICSELERIEKIQIKVGALAASAATYILAKFNKFSSAKSNSQFMIHKPSGGIHGNEDKIESDLQLLKNVTADYRAVYAECFGKTEDEVEQMWANGDKWLTAKEAKDLKLIASIEGKEEPIDNNTAAWLKACGAPKHTANIKPKPTNPNPKAMNDEELIAFLGLDANATPEEIKAALEALKDKADKYDEANKGGESEADKTAKEAVKKAVNDKKISADLTGHYVEIYKKSPAATQKVFDAMPVMPKLSSEVDNEKKKNIEATRKDWTLDDYLDKDPEAYKALKKDNPELAARLETEYFNTSK